MTTGKISFNIGSIQFTSEGEEKWVSEQLDKVLTQMPEILKIAPQTAGAGGEDADNGHKPIGTDTGIAKKTLPAFLTEKGATTNQVKKFLATAVWLESKGKNKMATKDVAAALKNTHQSRLGNPAECLNQNVAKGFCEKDGNEFFVTKEGKDSL